MKDQGVRVASRCLWDTATDNYASVEYTNQFLWCSAMVFGVYVRAYRLLATTQTLPRFALPLLFPGRHCPTAPAQLSPPAPPHPTPPPSGTRSRSNEQQTLDQVAPRILQRA